jgi:hypothetical protein
LKCGAGEGWRKSFGWIVRENKATLHKEKEERSILHAIKRRKVDWIGHILRRNCPLKQTVEGNIEGAIK